MCGEIDGSTRARLMLPWRLLLLLSTAVLGGSRGAMADEAFVVQFELSGTGVKDGATFLLRVHPSWAPLGARRFRELVEAKFYDDTRFFRVLDGMYDIWIAQFGVRLCAAPAASCAVGPQRALCSYSIVELRARWYADP